MFLAINNTNRWVLHLHYDPEQGERPENFSPEHCRAVIHQCLGEPPRALEVKGERSRPPSGSGICPLSLAEAYAEKQFVARRRDRHMKRSTARGERTGVGSVE
ncbi:hypothetical protein EI42_05690 [Thermosporothrix hazakensis]|uniref:Uncharacterized protein n=2 Tax=Thermosporothrix hazakensis TaxID=644383 RepID=A0A326TW14_THEHA|nr:hypothetical protein EI42_05690 [Thermosporothrix hazakensis]